MIGLLIALEYNDSVDVLVWFLNSQGLSRVLKAARFLADRSYHQKLEAGPGSRGLAPQFGPGYRPFGTASINVMDPISLRVCRPLCSVSLGMLCHSCRY